LFDNGANANEVDFLGNTAVHYVVQTGDLKWLKFIAKSFNLNCFLKNNLGNTPFIQACLNNNIEIVKYFITNLPNINWKNKLGQTALHAAVFSEHQNIVEILLINKADIRIKDIVTLKLKKFLNFLNVLYLMKKYRMI
jgi:ankyrin repeat protein